MGHYKDDPQVTYDLVDMGALTEPQYFWWKGVTVEHHPADDGTAPSDWCLRIQAVNPEDPDGEDESGQFPPVVKDIRHEDVVKAIDGILAGKFSGGEAKVAPATTERCQNLVEDPEHGYLSWDHWVSDELLQVIVYGKPEF
ncbi:hypothetical protein ACFW2V_13605 [Streptomyces sp. NPDC058947]|uniref:hypothetical protein n=1 Tax=Streptomyces sp. NPDC058947 TaxID=3346675 RepID=UPI00368A3968